MSTPTLMFRSILLENIRRNQLWLARFKSTLTPLKLKEFEEAIATAARRLDQHEKWGMAWGAQEAQRPRRRSTWVRPKGMCPAVTKTMLSFRGITMSVSKWARQEGIKPATLHKRLRMGWDIERALSRCPRTKAAAWYEKESASA